ncbi:hypothetical protein ATER59S_00819 [Aquamicrobium terrae]
MVMLRFCRWIARYSRIRFGRVEQVRAHWRSRV